VNHICFVYITVLNKTNWLVQYIVTLDDIIEWLVASTACHIEEHINDDMMDAFNS